MQGAMAGITRKISVIVFPLWPLQNQNGWVKSRENSMKNIIEISIAYQRFQKDEELEIKQGR